MTTKWPGSPQAARRCELHITFTITFLLRWLWGFPPISFFKPLCFPPLSLWLTQLSPPLQQTGICHPAAHSPLQTAQFWDLLNLLSELFLVSIINPTFFWLPPCPPMSPYLCKCCLSARWVLILVRALHGLTDLAIVHLPWETSFNLPETELPILSSCVPGEGLYHSFGPDHCNRLWLWLLSMKCQIPWSQEPLPIYLCSPSF